jgi:hypothetical protein
MFFVSLLALHITTVTNPDPSSERFDTSVIKARSGCFEVRYQFFDHDVPASDSTVIAKEFIDFEEISPDTFSMQHVSIGEDSDDPTTSANSVAIHWRELWTRSPKSMFEYEQKRIWNKVDREMNDDEWSYSVFQIDGSLRFQNIGQWTHDEKRGWEFRASAKAPLPRRESLADRPTELRYDVMERDLVARNTSFGYDEYLIAKKVRLSPQGREVVSTESGTTRFIRLDEKECADAKALLESQRDFWNQVNQAWEDVYTTNSRVELLSGRLIGEFIQLGQGFAAGKQPADLKTIVRSKIQQNLKQ